MIMKFLIIRAMTYYVIAIIYILFNRYYIVAIQMPSFGLTWVTMFLLYWKIWREAHMCARRINLSVISKIAEKNDRKSVQVRYDEFKR